MSALSIPAADRARAARLFVALEGALHDLCTLPHRFVGPWSVDTRGDRPEIRRRGVDGVDVAHVYISDGLPLWGVRFRVGDNGTTSTAGTADDLVAALRVVDLLLVTGGDVLVGGLPNAVRLAEFTADAAAFEDGTA